MLGGAPVVVIVHVEVQGRPDADFALRMFQYRYRLMDRYGTEAIISLAVLTYRRSGPEHAVYRYEDESGSRLEFEFPVLNLAGWLTRWAELQGHAEHNPFAVVVMAQLRAHASRGGDRLHWKVQLVRMLYQYAYPRDDILELIRLIDWMLALPASMDAAFVQSLSHITTEYDIVRPSIFERVEQRALQAAQLEGQMLGQVSVLRRQLTRRFGPLPDWAEQRLSQADEASLLQWTDRVLDAVSLEAVFAS